MKTDVFNFISLGTMSLKMAQRWVKPAIVVVVSKDSESCQKWSIFSGDDPNPVWSRNSLCSWNSVRGSFRHRQEICCSGSFGWLVAFLGMFVSSCWSWLILWWLWSQPIWCWSRSWFYGCWKVLIWDIVGVNRGVGLAGLEIWVSRDIDTCYSLWHLSWWAKRCNVI